MVERMRTLTIRMTDEELSQAHAVAEAGDESVGRYLRRVVAADYARRFGEAPAPKHTPKPGRPRR